MRTITSFDQLSECIVAERKLKNIVVACPHDKHSLDAIEMALERGIAKFTLVGDEELIRSSSTLPNDGKVNIINEVDTGKAIAMAVAAVKSKEADILMKGSVNTDNLVKAILDKEHGILCKGGILSHVTVMQIPGRSKLTFISDVAVIPYPNMEQKRQILRNILKCCRDFGVQVPKVALIHFTEKVNPKFPNSTDYVQLVAEASKGDYGDCIVDGPIDARAAFDHEAAMIKGINSPLEGDADALLFPNIESGNVFYKSMTYFCHAEIAGVFFGAQCPVVVSSRGDSEISKYNSIAMACALS